MLAEPLTAPNTDAKRSGDWRRGETHPKGTATRISVVNDDQKARRGTVPFSVVKFLMVSRSPAKRRFIAVLLNAARNGCRWKEAPTGKPTWAQMTFAVSVCEVSVDNVRVVHE